MIVNKNCFSDKFVGTSTLNNYLEGSFTSVFKFTIVLHNRKIFLNIAFDGEVLLRCSLKP